MTVDTSSDSERDGEQLWAAMRLEWLNLIDAAQSRLMHCLHQLSDEQLWQPPFPGGNSIANLLLHVCGNLRQWVIDGIRQSDSSRDRAAEFSAIGGLTKLDLTAAVIQTLEEVRVVLNEVPEEVVLAPRSIQGFRVTVLGAWAHSIPHLVGHTHQIVQITRMLLADQYIFHWTPDGDRSAVPL